MSALLQVRELASVCETKQVIEFGHLVTVYRLRGCADSKTVWRSESAMRAKLEREGWPAPYDPTAPVCEDCGLSGDLIGGKLKLHAECLETRR